MQCNQPFYVNGSPTIGQFYNCNQITPCNNTFPEIMGEGEIITLTTPDGVIRFFFIPTNPYFCNSSQSYPNWNYTNKHAWYIRNYPKQTSIPLFTSPLRQRLPEAYDFPQCNSYDCDMPTPPYKLKFHNDGWSSTTDLHYFTPCTRTCDLYFPQKCNAITQIEIPVPTNTYHYQIVCCCDSRGDKPCNCSAQSFKNNENRILCSCSNESQVSSMAVDAKSEEATCCVANAVQDPLKCTSHKNTNTKSVVMCDFDAEKRPSNNDKTVTTFTEQGCGCVAEVGCGTQSNSKESTVLKIKNVKQELWQPKTSLSKKSMKSKSENITTNDDNNTESCSCCELEH